MIKVCLSVCFVCLFVCVSVWPVHAHGSDNLDWVKISWPTTNKSDGTGPSYDHTLGNDQGLSVCLFVWLFVCLFVWLCVMMASAHGRTEGVTIWNRSTLYDHIFGNDQGLYVRLYMYMYVCLFVCVDGKCSWQSRGGDNLDWVRISRSTNWWNRPKLWPHLGKWPRFVYLFGCKMYVCLFVCEDDQCSWQTERVMIRTWWGSQGQQTLMEQGHGFDHALGNGQGTCTCVFICLYVCLFVCVWGWPVLVSIFLCYLLLQDITCLWISPQTLWPNLPETRLTCTVKSLTLLMRLALHSGIISGAQVSKLGEMVKEITWQKFLIWAVDTQFWKSDFYPLTCRSITCGLGERLIIPRQIRTSCKWTMTDRTGPSESCLLLKREENPDFLCYCVNRE